MVILAGRGSRDRPGFLTPGPRDACLPAQMRPVAASRLVEDRVPDSPAGGRRLWLRRSGVAGMAGLGWRWARAA